MFSGTAFLTVPPSILPILKVVSSSNLPCSKLVMSSEAILIADKPFSGSTPACAALPFTEILNPMYVGLAVKTRLTESLSSGLHVILFLLL